LDFGHIRKSRVWPFFLQRDALSDRYDLSMVPTSSSCGSELLLLVDDNQLFLKLLSKWAEDAGFQPVLASSAFEAMEILKEVRAATVISDCMMPGMDGTELCRTLRPKFQDGLLYFVLVTADEDPQAFAVAAQSGVDDFLTKPVRKDQFMARLQVARRIHATCEELSSSSSGLDEIHASRQELEEQISQIDEVRLALDVRARAGDPSFEELSQKMARATRELRELLGL
jgi:CheY-like chemotaxis protein